MTVYEAPLSEATLFLNPVRSVKLREESHAFVRNAPCGAEQKVTCKPQTK